MCVYDGSPAGRRAYRAGLTGESDPVVRREVSILSRWTGGGRRRNLLPFLRAARHEESQRVGRRRARTERAVELNRLFTSDEIECLLRAIAEVIYDGGLDVLSERQVTLASRAIAVMYPDDEADDADAETEGKS